ncbi:MAG: bifunctional riboflavin kinase/FAD synthetase [Pirellulaceae bacterium]|nr:bifunctional riboflavin kinase/FAD synthetase [Pirellulaceae bacterium]
MKLIRRIADITPELQFGAVTIGNFDGVHHGHAKILRRLIQHARRVGGPAVVFTFDPHPVRLLRPSLAPPPLTWTERKMELVAEIGVDALVAYPTDEKLLDLSPQEFFSDIILDTFRAQVVVEGPNFFFGKDRAGDVKLLTELCRVNSITADTVKPVESDDRYVSSSRIRDHIAAGDVAFAREMLTQPYRIRGVVIHGSARGAGIGFPTANVDAVDTLLPGPGVYAGRAYCEAGVWPAAINLGPNPTFGDQSCKLEVHLIGFDGGLYGQSLEVDFLARLRDVQSFDGIDPLKKQLQLDVLKATEVCQGFATRAGELP